MKHTQGNWIEKAYSGGDVAIYSEDENDNGYAIALVYNRKRECSANSRLIASAPDLLEALEALIITARTFTNHVPIDEQMWTYTDDKNLDRAFEAIAKARGEK